MDNKDFNKQRYNRKKQKCRFHLGVQQFLNCPVLIILWVLFAIGVVLMIKAEGIIIAQIEVYPLFNTVFSICIRIIFIVFPIICALGLVQFVGFCFAIRDEADMEIVFGDKKDVKNQAPILFYKKKNRKTGVTKREFYTSIPMARWQEKRDAICDRLNVHIIGDIMYGGKNHNKGNLIYLETAKGRIQAERGDLYDDEF